MARKELEEKDSRFRENIFQRTLNRMLVGMLIAISYLPFWILYRLSDVMYLFIRFIFRYRWKVITTNLRNAFSEKPESEIKQIRNRFYRHFCDVFFESIKIYSISDNAIGKRLLVKGADVANDFFDKGRSVVALAMHHNNWEWTGFAQSKLKHHILNIYNPVRGNQAMEDFLLHNRQKWGSTSIPVHKTARALVEYQAKGELTGLWLAADQTPPARSKFWTIFLNQETPFFQGPEKIATSTNQPVFFQHTKKTGRGRYVIEFTLLFENPKEVEQKEILLVYVRKAEEIIRAEPEYYLWSHRRWKHKRPEGVELTV
ncbi:MAG TPA: lipid A biosynthesis acyltransferase [Prolixibacteraceae bacterium]|nr:lipid A biosynthesis acyltransferase [Prolixibacteraceae bacterium]